MSIKQKSVYTSNSHSALKHRHAALLRNPALSYVLVWLSFNFISVG